MKQGIFFLFIVLFVAITGNSFTYPPDPELKGFIPTEGFIPDEKTAIKVAQAIWLPIYGKDVLRKKPYKATLIDGRIWIVEGTIRGLFARGGGTPYIEIDKYSGAIIRVTHTK